MAAAVQAVFEISHVILSLTGFGAEFRHRTPTICLPTIPRSAVFVSVVQVPP